MPVFTFSGKTASGEKVSGERVAASKQALQQSLRKERITAGSIREKGKEFSLPSFKSGKVKTKDIAVFFRQFSVMIDAGLPRAVFGNSWREPGEPDISEDAHRRPNDARRRRDARQRHAAVPGGV